MIKLIIAVAANIVLIPILSLILFALTYAACESVRKIYRMATRKKREREKKKEKFWSDMTT